MHSSDFFEGTVFWNFQNSELFLPQLGATSVVLQVLKVTAHMCMHAHTRTPMHRCASPVYLLSSIRVVNTELEGNSLVFKLKLYDVYWQES